MTSSAAVSRTSPPLTGPATAAFTTVSEAMAPPALNMSTRPMLAQSVCNRNTVATTTTTTTAGTAAERRKRGTRAAIDAAEARRKEGKRKENRPKRISVKTNYEAVFQGK